MQSRDRIENVHTYPSAEIVLSKLVAIICNHSYKGLIQVDDPRRLFVDLFVQRHFTDHLNKFFSRSCMYDSFDDFICKSVPSLGQVVEWWVTMDHQEFIIKRISSSLSIYFSIYPTLTNKFEQGAEIVETSSTRSFFFLINQAKNDVQKFNQASKQRWLIGQLRLIEECEVEVNVDPF